MLIVFKSVSCKDDIFLILTYKVTEIILTACMTIASHLKRVFISAHVKSCLVGLIVWDQKNNRTKQRHVITYRLKAVICHYTYAYIIKAKD